MVFSLHGSLQELEMGLLQHNLTMCLVEGQMKEMLKRIRWNLREEAKSLPPFDEFPTLQHLFLTNVMIWNYRGTLKPSFQIHVRELVCNHNLTILVLMETQIGGGKAREVSSRLPFDGAVHTDTVGYASGLWLLWNFDRVEVTTLSSIEQEIHAVVKAIGAPVSPNSV
ncbi:hypothetical protein ACB092_01G239100 [Castanea dentata]